MALAVQTPASPLFCCRTDLLYANVCADMKVLEGMTGLQQLDLSGTRVSIVGLEGCLQLSTLTSLATGSQ